MPGSSFGCGPAGGPLASGPVPGEGEDRGVQAGQLGIGAGGLVPAVPAGGIGDDVGADEGGDGGERDERRVEPGGSGGGAAAVAVMLWISRSAQASWRASSGDWPRNGRRGPR